AALSVATHESARQKKVAAGRAYARQEPGGGLDPSSVEHAGAGVHGGEPSPQDAVRWEQGGPEGTQPGPPPQAELSRGGVGAPTNPPPKQPGPPGGGTQLDLQAQGYSRNTRLRPAPQRATPPGTVTPAQPRALPDLSGGVGSGASFGAGSALPRI